MKKQILLVALMSTGLVACGGGGSGGSSGGGSGTQLTTPAANVLTVKGTGVDKQETITVDKKDILISAIGNQPIQLVEFYQRPESYDWYGRIALSTNSNKAQLDKLAFDNRNTAFLLCAANSCQENTTYGLQHGTQQSILSINFDQAPNNYRLGGSNESKPVKVSGNLQFGIPANWPIVHSQRFPVANVQGQLAWGGQQYQLSAVDDITATVHKLTLRGPTGLIYLTVNQLSANSFKLELKDGVKTYSTGDLNITGVMVPWQETLQQIKVELGLLGVALFNDNGGEPARALTGSLLIPKATFNLNVDGEILDGGNIKLVGAYAENESKYYALTLKQVDGNTTVSTYAEIRQELDGHLWLDYYGGEDSPSCGSPTTACAGLTVDADKKTYRFNNVRLGDFSIKGTAFIPGVFE